MGRKKRRGGGLTLNQERCVRKLKKRLPKKCKVLGYPGTKACPNPFAICKSTVK